MNPYSYRLFHNHFAGQEFALVGSKKFNRVRYHAQKNILIIRRKELSHSTDGIPKAKIGNIRSNVDKREQILVSRFCPKEGKNPRLRCKDFVNSYNKYVGYTSRKPFHVRNGLSCPFGQRGFIKQLENFTYQGPVHGSPAAILTGCNVSPGLDGYDEEVTPRRLKSIDRYREHLRKEGHTIPHPKHGERVIFRPYQMGTDNVRNLKTQYVIVGDPHGQKILSRALLRMRKEALKGITGKILKKSPEDEEANCSKTSPCF